MEGRGTPKKTSPRNSNHHINCHEQYKNTGRRVIIIRAAWTCLKLLASPVLPSFSRSHNQPYSKSLSQSTTIGAHYEADVKTHMSRLMTSTINIFHNKSFFNVGAARSGGIYVGDALSSTGTHPAGFRFGRRWLSDMAHIEAHDRRPWCMPLCLLGCFLRSIRSSCHAVLSAYWIQLLYEPGTSLSRDKHLHMVS
jgi:hypothetical protein